MLFLFEGEGPHSPLLALNSPIVVLMVLFSALQPLSMVAEVVLHSGACLVLSRPKVVLFPESGCLLAVNILSGWCIYSMGLPRCSVWAPVGSPTILLL